MRARAVLVAAALAACDGTFRFDDQSIDGGAGAVAPPCHDSAACHGLRCDRATGLCVACTDDDDCVSPRPRCDRDQHVCVECRDSAECGADRRCEPSTHRCVELCAAGDARCSSAGFACNEAVGLCAECTADEDCASAAGGPFCDPAIGRCVECLSNAQCAASAAVCDRRTGQCAACVSSTSCGAGRVCDPVRLVCRAP